MKEKMRRIFSFIRRNKVTTKMISFVLSLVLIFYVIPSSIYSEAAELFENDEAIKNDVSAIETEQSSNVFEVKELRDASTKHFKTEDGSYVLAQYNNNVHYLDENGEWADYDNTISETLLSGYTTPDSSVKFSKKINGSGNVLTLKNDNLKISVSAIDTNKTNAEVINNNDAEDLTELQKLMNLEKLSSSVIYPDAWENTDLEYVLIGEKIKENIIVKDRRESYTYSFELKLQGLSATLEENGDISLRNKTSGELEYTIPAPVVYDAYGEMPDKSEAYYELSGKNNKYILTVTVASEWMNSEDVSFPITIDPTIAAPETTAVEDTSWLSGNDEYQLYLLHIRPLCPAFWKLTYIPTLPYSAHITKANLKIYYHSSAGKFTPDLQIRRVNSYWTETQAIPSDISVSNEVYAISPINYSGGLHYSFDITTLLNDWIENPENNHGVKIEYSNPAQFFGLDITTRLHSHKSIDTLYINYPALEINYTNPVGTENYYTYSSQSAGAAGVGSVSHLTGNLTWKIPTLTTSSPLLSYTPTLVYNESLAGKSYTSDNTDTAYSTAFLGNGFKLNLCETLVKKVYFDNAMTPHYYYVYEDGDGTSHMFFQSDSNENIYFDNSGLNKKLQISGNIIIMTDDSNIRKSFKPISFESQPSTLAAWVMYAVSDSYNNTLRFNTHADGRPSSITLIPRGSTTDINLLKFVYNNENKLIMIYNPTTMDAAVLRYSSDYKTAISTSECKYLKQIDFVLANNSTVTLSDIQSFYETGSSTKLTLSSNASYGYTSAGQLVSVITEDNRRILYSYSQNKVRSVTEIASTSVGQRLLIEYHTGYTDITSSGNDDIIATDDDVITRYVFDNLGRTVGVYSFSSDNSTIYSASSGEYEATEYAKNNIKQQIAIGGVNVNYLLNGDFEEEGADGKLLHWIESHDNYISLTTTSYISSDFAGSYDDEGYYAALLNPQSGNTATLSQRVFLPAGDYTLSMCYYSFKALGYVAGARVSSLSGSGLLHSENIVLNDENVTGKNSVFSTTFTVPDHINGGDNVEVSFWITDPIETINSSFKFCIDRVMLTRNVGAEDFSMVDYGSFDANHISDNGSFTDISSKWLWGEDGDSAVDIVDSEAPFGKAAKVDESVGMMYQRVYEIPESQLEQYLSQDFVSNAGFNYIISGFAKATNAVASTDTSVFRIRVAVTYHQGNTGDYVEEFELDFLDNCDGWQFATGSFSTQHIASGDDFTYKCIKFIDVYCEYYGQPTGSYALFDNISIIQCTENNMAAYKYYDNAGDNSNLAGLLATKSTIKYKEYYEYDANRNLTRVANTRGDIVDYEYYSNNEVKSVTTKRFTYDGTYNYPFNIDFIGNNTNHANDGVTYTTLSSTEYIYNAYGLNTAVKVYSTDSGSNKIMTTEYEYNLTVGNPLFGILTTEYDINGNEIHYYYDSRGRLVSKLNSLGGVHYTYDAKGRLDIVKPATPNSSTGYSPVNNAEYVNYSYSNLDRISDITTATTNYSFTYDNFGNVLTISAGGCTLATYEYNKNNGKLNKVTYGNGLIVEYVYNSLEILSEVWYTENGTKYMAYKYEYNADGSLYREVDCIAGKSVVYKYDTLNRIVAFNESSTDELYYNFASTRKYNDIHQLVNTYHYLDYEAGGSTYTEYIEHLFYYDSSDESLYYELTGTYNGGQIGIHYDYDGFDRITSVDKRNGSFSQVLDYTYSDYRTNTTGTQIHSVTSTVNGVSTTSVITYDANGNITKIDYGNGQEIRYYYDDLGQLIREDNEITGATVLYEYDNGGNITGIYTMQLDYGTVTPDDADFDVHLSYDDIDEWQDLLTSYNGQTITYDGIGNPLSYYNGTSYSFTWQGRRMITATRGGKTYSYTYNNDGLRTSKTVDGVTTNYYYDGSLLVAEQSDSETIIYIYDANGSPVGFQYRNSTYAEKTFDTYWYEKDMFGNIVGVYNKNGVKLVSYEYNAWGICYEQYYNGGANTSVVKNPYTYRGYYYDSDLGLYYLESRYYDPNTCRFINADGYVSTGQGLLGYNMFAYCGNNPVMRVDPNGEGWILVVVVVALAIVDFAIESNINAIISSNIMASNDEVKPMDDETYSKYDQDTESTGGMSYEERIAYVRKVREGWKIDSPSKLDEWSEAEMLRELDYHEDACAILVFFGADVTVEGSWAYRLNHVSFEVKQTFTTYARRFVGNMIPW